MEKPEVSIIVTCYNLGSYLSDAINSVLGQNFSSWECIIVNDGSTDNTDEIVPELLHKDSRLRYYKIENRGLCGARNFGISKAKGDIILPLDADDMIGPMYLSEAVPILRARSDIGIVYCEAELFGAKSGKWNLPPFSVPEILFENSIFCSALFRKSDFDQTPGYNQNMVFGYEDWDLWLSLIERGFGVYRLSGTHFYYRIKDSDSMIVRLLSNPENVKISLMNIYGNHISLYTKYLGLHVETYRKLVALQRSKEYRLGFILLKPIRIAYRVFKRIKHFS